jgi:methylmalonyl-CoA mutase N-terminal domain/subunit
MGVAKYHKDEKDAITEVIYQSGIRVKSVYGPKDLEEIGFDYQSDLGDPGEYPFTRSLHPQGYRSRAVFIRRVTAAGPGQLGSTRVSVRRKRPTSALNT